MAPYDRSAPRKPEAKDAPKTSARKITNKKENLTLHDWITVFNYIDEHQNASQDAIVKHFKTRVEGALIFDQSTLSRNLKRRKEMEARVHENPNALSSKRPRIVTRPDVEKALFLWFKHMEEKGETVSGPMLVTKRTRFEEKFNVPQEERLGGDGWVASFCKAYKIKERRRHGEAGSVDLATVKAERVRVATILSNFAPKDRFNFDETSFFAL